MTPPAWTSLVTGVNPGRHNIFGFSQPVGSQMRIVNRILRKAPPVWDNLEGECVKVVVNVPMTYPVSKINGCIVADSLTLVREGEWVWPKEEQAHLERLGYDACLMSHISEVRGPRQLEASTEVRGEVFLQLEEKYQPCFSMVVFSETDWVQHIFPNNVKYISSVYKRVDRFLGKLLSILERDSQIMIVSDHGFRVAKRKFFVNNWLSRIGLLKVNNLESARTRIIGKVTSQAAVLLPLAVRTTPRHIRERLAPRVFSPADHLTSIAGVYHSGWDLGQYLRLYLTDSERERYETIYTELVRSSESLVDTATGTRPILRVLRKSDIYSGQFVVSAPDFVLELDPLYSGNEKILNSTESFLDYTIGIHRREGIFIAKWINSQEYVARKESLGEIDICDVAPTIAQVFGKNMRSDGQALSLFSTSHS